LKVSELNERIVIQSQTDTVTPSGERTKVWGTESAIWARVREQSETESVSGGTGNELVQSITEFTIRARRDISTANRVLYRGRAYDVIEFLQLHGSREWSKIKAVKRDKQSE